MTLRFSLIILLLFVCGGCHKSRVPGLVKAEGVLLYDGQPLPWARITFVPQKTGNGARQATGQSNAKGVFSLHTMGETGAVPGEYKVCVEKYIRNEGKDSVKNWKKARKENDFQEPEPEKNTMNVVAAIPQKFMTTQKSGLSLTVAPKGSRDLRLELDD